MSEKCEKCGDAMARTRDGSLVCPMCLALENQEFAEKFIQKQAECDKWIDALDDAMHRLEVEGQKLAQAKAENERLKDNLPDLKLVADFLDNLSERLGNAGCNDLCLANTADNRAMWEAAGEAEDRGADWPPPETDAMFYAVDFVVVDYLAARLREAAGKE